MRIYPAIDIKDGKCVRLFKGQFSDVTVYGDSPAEMAKKWESLGGEYIHVVDLDGALKGHGVNAAKIKEYAKASMFPYKQAAVFVLLRILRQNLPVVLTE